MNVLFSFIARHKKVCLSDVTIFLQPPMHALVTRPYFSTPLQPSSSYGHTKLNTHVLHTSETSTKFETPKSVGCVRSN